LQMLIAVVVFHILIYHSPIWPPSTIPWYIGIFNFQAKTLKYSYVFLLELFSSWREKEKPKIYALIV
jgi:hypothetical protein